MSRVFDVPRYKDQTLDKIFLYINLFSKEKAEQLCKTRFGNSRAHSKTFTEAIQNLILYDEFEHRHISPVANEDISDIEMYERSMIHSLALVKERYFMPMQTNAGELIVQLIEKHKNLPVWCDSDAGFRIIHGYISAKYAARRSKLNINAHEFAQKSTIDFLAFSTVADNHGRNVLNRGTRDVTFPSDGSAVWQCLRNWFLAFTDMKLRSATPANNEAHKNMKEMFRAPPLENFSFLEMQSGSCLGVEECYRIMNHFFLVYHDAIYILDHSELDQIHKCAKMWEGFYAYAENYRVCGGIEDKWSKFDMKKAVRKCQEYIAKIMEESGFSDKIARCMKMSTHIIYNDFHSNAEVFDVGHEAKSVHLEDELQSYIKLEQYWHQFLYNLAVPGRVLIDLQNMYYAISSPDCDLRLLWKKASVTMQNARQADPIAFRKFLSYVKATDYCRAISKKHAPVNRKCAKDYEPDEKEWHKSCINGKYTIPPEEEWGKVWICGEYPYNDWLPLWYWDCADVTRVNPDMTEYESILKSIEVPRSETSELLYAIDNAPFLTPRHTPEGVVEAMVARSYTWDCIAAMAAKNENTKPGEKARETWSADAITRELTSCYDRTSIPLASLYDGASARKADYIVQRNFDRVCEFIDPQNRKKRCGIVISNDVSGWSPSADRQLWSWHHDYICETTRSPKYLRMYQIWQNINVVLCKRGFLAQMPMQTGLFQGWTGGMDTLLNLHMSLYCVRVSKQRGYLNQNAGAITASLIDDAVQAIELTGSAAEQQRAASHHMEVTREVWSSLAAEIDVWKTLYSSCKFIFLNRFFCEGTEVHAPMKVFAKADKEWQRRFADIHSQFDTIFGAYASAVLKGADPIVSYAMALHRCFEFVYLTNNCVKYTKAEVAVCIAAAPRSAGGYGFPTMQSWLTQESKDDLSRFVYAVCANARFFPIMKNIMYSILKQPFKKATFSDIVSAPMQVKYATVRNPAGVVLGIIKRKMALSAKSEVFQRVLHCDFGEEAQNHALNFVRSCDWDPAILELLGQCTPQAHASSLADRAYKNEAVSALMPFRVRQDLISKMRRANFQAIGHLHYLEVRDFSEEVDLSRSRAYEITFSIREAYYEYNDIHIYNHTLPSYASSLAHAATEQGAALSCNTKKLLRACPSENHEYYNMYDARIEGLKYTPGKTSKPYVFAGERFAGMSPIQLCVTKSAITCAYVSSRGGSGKELWDFLMALWGAPANFPPPVVATSIDKSASTKRLSASRSHVTHSMMQFKNTQGAIAVNVKSLSTELDRSSYHVDYMSFITAARSIALVEVACLNTKREVGEFSLHYALMEGSLPESVDVTCNIADLDCATTSTEEMRKWVNKDLFKDLLEAMTISNQCDYTEANRLVENEAGEIGEVQVLDDEPFQGIAFNEDQRTRMMNQPGLKQGSLAMIVLTGAAVPAAASRHVVRLRTEGDMAVYSAGQSAERILREYTAIVSTGQAAICTLLRLVLLTHKSETNWAIMKATPEDLDRVYEDANPNWHARWHGMMRWAKRHFGRLSNNVVLDLFGKSRKHAEAVTALAALDENNTPGSLHAMALLYRSAHGRPPNAASYTATCALGYTHIKRCWKVAAEVRSIHSDDPLQIASRNLYRHLHMACNQNATAYDLMKALLNSIATTACQVIGEEFAISRAMVAMNRQLNELKHNLRAVDYSDPEFVIPLEDKLEIIRLWDIAVRKRASIGHLLEQTIDDARNFNRIIVKDYEGMRLIDEDAYRGEAPASLLEFELPQMPDYEVHEAYGEATEQVDEHSDDFLNAVVASAERTLEECLKIETGELHFVREYEPDQDDIDQYLEDRANFIKGGIQLVDRDDK